jgi:hypothetical protein
MQVTSTDTDQLYVEEPCSSVTGLQNSSTLVTDKGNLKIKFIM